MHVRKLAVYTSSSHSHWQAVYEAVRMACFFSAAQPSCAFDSTHILRHVNTRNDDVVAKKIQ